MQNPEIQHNETLTVKERPERRQNVQDVPTNMEAHQNESENGDRSRQNVPENRDQDVENLEMRTKTESNLRKKKKIFLLVCH